MCVCTYVFPQVKYISYYVRLSLGRLLSVANITPGTVKKIDITTREQPCAPHL